jgi:hypothetical protein
VKLTLYPGTGEAPTATAPMAQFGGSLTDAAGEQLTRQWQLLVEEEETDVAASVRGEAMGSVGEFDEVCEAALSVTCQAGVFREQQARRTRWADGG